MTTTQQTLSIVSYNIQHGVGMDGVMNLERTAAALVCVQPDLVAVQEVDKNCRRSGDRDSASELGRILGLHHAFGKAMDFDGGEYGLAVLSRYPIDDAITHRLPDGAEPRCALEIVVRPGMMTTPLSFVCIHLDWSKEDLRLIQMEALLKLLHTRNHPIVLAGDFNGERGDKAMQRLAGAGWSILDKNDAKTFPADSPRIEVDFVALYGFPPASTTCRILDERVASDHKPIHALLTLMDQH